MQRGCLCNKLILQELDDTLFPIQQQVMNRLLIGPSSKSALLPTLWHVEDTPAPDIHFHDSIVLIGDGLIEELRSKKEIQGSLSQWVVSYCRGDTNVIA